MKIVGENCTTEEVLAALRQAYAGGIVTGLDTETKGIDPGSTAAAHGGEGQIVCWSLSIPDTPYEKVFLWADQLPKFKPWLENKEALKCGHNIFGFDRHMFANHGINLMGIAGDTLRLSRLLYSCKLRKHGLKPLALHRLGIKQDKFKDLFMRPRSSVRFVQEQKKVKGEVILLDYRYTKRKVGDHKGVPTILATGERGFFVKTTEFIPLDEIPRDYPDRLQALYEYATADAYITQKLYYDFKRELSEVEWIISK